MQCHVHCLFWPVKIANSCYCNAWSHCGLASDNLTWVTGLGSSTAALYPRDLSPRAELDLFIHLRLQEENSLRTSCKQMWKTDSKGEWGNHFSEWANEEIISDTICDLNLQDCLDDYVWVDINNTHMCVNNDCMWYLILTIFLNFVLWLKILLKNT